MELCALCKKNEADRVIHGVPICDECFVEGRYDLPETHIKLIEMSGRPMPVSAQVKAQAKAPAEGQGFGDYLCPKCKVTHRAGSKIHKRHLKLL